MTREPDYGGEDCSANGAPSPRRSGLNLICFVGGSSGLPGERTIVKDRDGEAHGAWRRASGSPKTVTSAPGSTSRDSRNAESSRDARYSGTLIATDSLQTGSTRSGARASTSSRRSPGNECRIASPGANAPRSRKSEACPVPERSVVIGCGCRPLPSVNQPLLVQLPSTVKSTARCKL
jgi:hypothetical protein